MHPKSNSRPQNPATANHDVTGLILAGGAGHRVGGEDKGLLEWNELPLIEHVRSRLLPQVVDLIISCNRNVERYGQYADITVSDSRQGYQGPLAGIEAAIPHVRTKFLAVVACDTPLLPTDLVVRLMGACNSKHPRPDISYAQDGQRQQFLFALLHRDCLASLTHFLDSGERAVSRWYSEKNALGVDFSDCRQAFLNFNQLD